jgi:hypothetical protein
MDTSKAARQPGRVEKSNGPGKTASPPEQLKPKPQILVRTLRRNQCSLAAIATCSSSCTSDSKKCRPNSDTASSGFAHLVLLLLRLLEPTFQPQAVRVRSRRQTLTVTCNLQTLSHKQTLIQLKSKGSQRFSGSLTKTRTVVTQEKRWNKPLLPNLKCGLNTLESKIAPKKFEDCGPLFKANEERTVFIEKLNILTREASECVFCSPSTQHPAGCPPSVPAIEM